jgi:hypothetical protein
VAGARLSLVLLTGLAVAANRPGAEYDFAWAEHPEGEISMRVDACGFRSPSEGAPADADTLILVVGDSHTFGVADNDELFTSRLQRRLQERRDGRTYEVVNAAVPGTGPFEYRRSVRRHLALDPQLVVVVPFVGNDFWDTLKYDAFLTKQPLAMLGPDDQRRMALARSRHLWRPIMAQGIGQAFEFNGQPENAARALRATTEVFDDIVEATRERSIPLLVVPLPAKPEVDREGDHAEELVALLGVLEMDPGRFAVNRRLADELVKHHRRLDIAVFDPVQAMLEHDRPLYWSKDHHLGLEGHRWLGDALVEPVLEALSPAR